MIIEGLKMDPEKIRVMVKFPTPTNITKILAFQGLVNYYQRFIYKFLNILTPMMNLLKKDKSFK